MATDRTSLLRTTVSNISVVVIHGWDLQQRFSCSVAITWHLPQRHHGRLLLPPEGSLGPPSTNALVITARQPTDSEECGSADIWVGETER